MYEDSHSSVCVYAAVDQLERIKIKLRGDGHVIRYDEAELW